MPQISLVDETWIAARPEIVAAAVGDERNWPRWWPHLRLEVAERRGVEGVRWRVVGGAGIGSMEVWLHASLDGVALHYFLRLDPRDGRVLSPRAAARARRRHTRHAKQVFWALKDELEGRARR